MLVSVVPDRVPVSVVCKLLRSVVIAVCTAARLVSDETELMSAKILFAVVWSVASAAAVGSRDSKSTMLPLMSASSVFSAGFTNSPVMVRLANVALAELSTTVMPPTERLFALRSCGLSVILILILNQKKKIKTDVGASRTLL